MGRGRRLRESGANELRVRTLARLGMTLLVVVPILALLLAGNVELSRTSEMLLAGGTGASMVLGLLLMGAGWLLDVGIAGALRALAPYPLIGGGGWLLLTGVYVGIGSNATMAWSMAGVGWGVAAGVVAVGVGVLALMVASTLDGADEADEVG